MCAKFLADNVLQPSLLASYEGRRQASQRFDHIAVTLEMAYLRLLRIEQLVCSSKSMLDGILCRAGTLYARLKDGAGEHHGEFGTPARSTEEPKRTGPLDEMLHAVEEIYRHCQVVNGQRSPFARQRHQPKSVAPKSRSDSRLRVPVTPQNPALSFEFEVLADQKMVLCESGVEALRQAQPLQSSLFSVGRPSALLDFSSFSDAARQGLELAPSAHSLDRSASLKTSAVVSCAKPDPHSSSRGSIVYDDLPHPVKMSTEPEKEDYAGQRRRARSRGREAASGAPTRKPSLGPRDSQLFSPMRARAFFGNFWRFNFRRNPPRLPPKTPGERQHSRVEVSNSKSIACTRSLRETMQGPPPPLGRAFTQQLFDLRVRED